jgi:hypothetical protein
MVKRSVKTTYSQICKQPGQQKREDGADRLASYKVEDKLKLILVQVGWGDNGGNQTERGLF